MTFKRWTNKRVTRFEHPTLLMQNRQTVKKHLFFLQKNFSFKQFQDMSPFHPYPSYLILHPSSFHPHPSKHSFNLLTQLFTFVAS